VFNCIKSLTERKNIISCAELWSWKMNVLKTWIEFLLARSKISFYIILFAFASEISCRDLRMKISDFCLFSKPHAVSRLFGSFFPLLCFFIMLHKSLSDFTLFLLTWRQTAEKWKWKFIGKTVKNFNFMFFFHHLLSHIHYTFCLKNLQWK
jgi:hypothetical protein